MVQRILIIDDSLPIHRLLEARLKQEGLSLQSELSAEAGLQAALASPPDLILLDVEMPEKSGFQLCETLKSDPRTAPVPVIFLTGASSPEEKVRGFDLGAVDYILKPFEPAELRARVRAALRTKRYLDLLSARAQTDGLTGVWNRTYFERRIIEEVSAFGRYGRPLSLVMVDVDHFKRLNDGFGHPFGDRALQAVAETLSVTLRTTDTLCRYGGEEFAIILGETGGDGSMRAAERLRLRVEKLDLEERGQKVPVSASFGVAAAEWVEERPVTRESLLSAADGALYAAKGGGRNRVCRPPPSSHEAPQDKR